MTLNRLSITFEREDGTTYEAEMGYNQPVRLIDGEMVLANQLTVGDEIESHYSQEMGPGSRGHRVVA